MKITHYNIDTISQTTCVFVVRIHACVLYKLYILIENVPYVNNLQEIACAKKLIFNVRQS